MADSFKFKTTSSSCVVSGRLRIFTVADLLSIEDAKVACELLSWSARRDCASEEETLELGVGVARRKRYQPEQVVHLLRQIEIAVATGKSIDQACRDAGIVGQTFYRCFPILDRDGGFLTRSSLAPALGS